MGSACPQQGAAAAGHWMRQELLLRIPFREILHFLHGKFCRETGVKLPFDPLSTRFRSMPAGFPEIF